MPKSSTPPRMTDAQFIQLRFIRKDHARDMGSIACKIRRLAREAKIIEERMQRKAETIMISGGETFPLASFVPNGPIRNQRISSTPIILPDFADVERMASNIMRLAENAIEDDTIVISKEQQNIYARVHLGISTDLPRDFNPATHITYGDLRALSPTLIHKQREEYETPAGGWIVDVGGNEEYVPESPRTPA